MTITISLLSPSMVALLTPHANLDATTYADLLAQALAARAAGANSIILDFRYVATLSSAGLVALHALARMLRDQPSSSPEHGWAALHALTEESDSALRLSLVNVRPQLRALLERPPFSTFLAIYPDVVGALATTAVA